MRFVVNQRLAGSDGMSLDLRSSSLSWSEHRALVATAAASAQAAFEMGLARRALEQLHYDIADVTAAVEQMEHELGLRLDVQNEILREQTELLGSIDTSLRTPARTKAAERIVTAAELLNNERYERARGVAEQAIDDDPNNPGGFVAAAWALLGLDQPEEARAMFREAAECSASETIIRARRNAARLTFVLEGPEAALEELQFFRVKELLSLSSFLSGAVRFDRAVYQAAQGDVRAAIDELRRATADDRRFCLMAFADPVLSRETSVIAAVEELLKELDNCRRDVVDRFRDVRERLMAVLSELTANAEWDIEEYRYEDERLVGSDVRTATEQSARFTDAALANCGFDALQKALKAAAAALPGATAVAERGEDYVAAQRDRVRALRSEAQRQDVHVLGTPRREYHGVWEIGVAKRGAWGGLRAWFIICGSWGVEGHVEGVDPEAAVARWAGIDFDSPDGPLSRGLVKALARAASRAIETAIARGPNDAIRWPYLEPAARLRPHDGARAAGQAVGARRGGLLTEPAPFACVSARCESRGLPTPLRRCDLCGQLTQPISGGGT
jgi:tetratricopeptide (TPR) repeat protein